MIKDGQYICKCGRKIMPIGQHDTLVTELYCRHCKRTHKVVIADGVQYSVVVSLPLLKGVDNEDC